MDERRAEEVNMPHDDECPWDSIEIQGPDGERFFLSGSLDLLLDLPPPCVCSRAKRIAEHLPTASKLP